MMVRRFLILALVVVASLSPAMTLAAYPHCALEGADCGAPCASPPTIPAPVSTVVSITSPTAVVDGPPAVIPQAPIRLADVPPRTVSSA